MKKPDNLVALHKQMTGSYVVDAPPLVTQPLDWWALNLIEGLQADRERVVEALRNLHDTASEDAFVAAGLLLSELEGNND